MKYKVFIYSYKRLNLDLILKALIGNLNNIKIMIIVNISKVF